MVLDLEIQTANEPRNETVFVAKFAVVLSWCIAHSSSSLPVTASGTGNSVCSTVLCQLKNDTKNKAGNNRERKKANKPVQHAEFDDWDNDK